MADTKMSEKLWSDCKSDQERADFILCGRAYETGVIAKSIQSEVAMAFQRLATLQATPPADAALAELALYLDRMADRVRTDVMDCARLRQAAAALRARAVQQSAPAGFVEWLCQEMPPGTVISDPAWWAPKIHRALLAASKAGEGKV